MWNGWLKSVVSRSRIQRAPAAGRVFQQFSRLQRHVAQASASPTGPEPELTVASAFTNNMVLQRDIPIAIWGTAEPGASVDLRFAGQQAATTAAPDGTWSLKLAAMAANAEGQTLTVQSGSQEHSFGNVVVGEVWLCSGQSNMGWTLKDSADASEHIRNAVNPNIRFLPVPVVRSDRLETRLPACSWLPSHPDHAENWSAVAYHFATKLQEELQVPIGIIWASLGATKIQEWMSEQMNAIHAYDIPEEWNTNPSSSLFNGMIAPLIPFAIRGAAWYQGEENHWGAGVYQTQQAALIEDWRERWAQGSFPFVYVQLASFGKTNTDPWSAWAELQEAQLEALRHPNTAMVVAIDMGDAFDIHPPRKQPVGERLATAALGKVYKRRQLFSGPLFREFQREGDKLRLFFDHADDGLTTTDGGPLRWFEIADLGPAGAGLPKYMPASATIDGATVVVSAAGVVDPIAVRYAFNSNPEGCNLCNRAMLPASPFRTSKDWSVTLGNDPRRLVRHVPVAMHERVVMAPLGSLPICLNASSQAGRVLTYEVVEGPTYGTLSGTAPSLIYQHRFVAKNQDRVTFRVSDGLHVSNVATVIVDVLAD
jgi:sialate O-acetylesterase